MTRHILEQTHRDGDELIAARSEIAGMRSELGAVKSRVDHLADVAFVKAAVTSHTALLNVLTLDVGQLRQDVAAIRAAVVPRDPSAGASE